MPLVASSFLGCGTPTYICLRSVLSRSRSLFPMASRACETWAAISPMVAAGVSTLAALQSATSEPARAFGLTDTVGAISAGQAADLLVLDADPLAAINNTRRIYAVVLNGHWFAR
jgi:imidazolonepropionase-like amidohydrolase